MEMREKLIAFEKRVATAFELAQIHAPVHLAGGNEDELIRIFKLIKPQDWVLTTYRSHYHALLRGIPEEWLWNEIMKGRSMYICSKEHRFLSSAIVGGMLPIALGIAWAIKQRGGSERVWCFVGDMAAETGIFHEVCKYRFYWDLPLDIVIEDNGLSTNTPTATVWGFENSGPQFRDSQPILRRYKYSRFWPHVGVGKWVTFG